MEEETTSLAFRSPRLGFRQGARSLPRAAGFLLKRPKHLGLCLAPWVLNLVVLGPVLYFVMRGLVYPWIIEMLPEGTSVWAVALRWTVGMPLALMLAGMSLLIYILAAMLLGAPFHDKVGELIERERLASRPELLAPKTPFWAGVRHSIAEAIKRLMIGLPFIVVGFLLGCIPFVGPLLGLIWNWTFASFFMTLDAFSMPMDRRRIPMAGKWQWVSNHFRFALGFGLPMLLVPCAVFIMPPLACVAAALIYTDVLLSGEKPVVEEH